MTVSSFVCLISVLAQPNCLTRVVDVDGVSKIVVFTNRFVRKGEEITYDYYFASEEDSAEKLTCNCGASNCAGRLN